MVLVACNQDDSSDPAGRTELVKTQELSFPVGTGIPTITTSYVYDTQDRLRSIKYSSGDSVAMEYAGNTITERKFSSPGLLHTTNYYYLNNFGLVDSSVENNGQLRTKATYDQNKYLVRLTVYDQNDNIESVHNHQISEGNVVYSDTRDAFGVIEISQDNFFDLNKKSSLRNQNIGQPYRGESSVHCGTMVNYQDHVFMSSQTFLYEYTFDTKGRIETVVYKVGDVISTSKYTYY